jgi:hypothetical protein
MVAVMEAVIQPPNVAHHQRAAFHASTQGECDLNIYVQELRQRRASMAANAIAEDVMVTVFMDNMKAGPAMIALSREEPTTLVEAFAIALLEDHVQTCTRSSGPADSWLCDGVAYVAAPGACRSDVCVASSPQSSGSHCRRSRRNRRERASHQVFYLLQGGSLPA